MATTRTELAECAHLHARLVNGTSEFSQTKQKRCRVSRASQDARPEPKAPAKGVLVGYGGTRCTTSGASCPSSIYPRAWNHIEYSPAFPSIVNIRLWRCFTSRARQERGLRLAGEGFFVMCLAGEGAYDETRTKTSLRKLRIIGSPVPPIQTPIMLYDDKFDDNSRPAKGTFQGAGPLVDDDRSCPRGVGRRTKLRDDDAARAHISDTDPKNFDEFSENK